MDTTGCYNIPYLVHDADNESFVKTFFMYVYVLIETQTNRNINPLFLHTRLTYENITFNTLTPIWFIMNNLLINHKLTYEKNSLFMSVYTLLGELENDAWLALLRCYITIQ